ncbi:MAG: two-component sensor histidine kinase [Hyphomicrobiales bacterium]|nr:two-component sensor histidine kinase [Hyphomicrobiales bacterium]
MSLSFFPAYFERPRAIWRDLTRRLADYMPKGLYARSLLIVIVPMVVLQSAIAYFFMERHWQLVTFRLSQAVVQDIASVSDLYRANPLPENVRLIQKVATERLGLDVEFLPKEPLPPALPKPFFSILDQALSREISTQIKRPFWIDTVGRSSLVEIRIQLDNAVMRVVANRNAAYASNSHIFLVWMVGTSLVLLAVSIAFLRNQIRPILRLAGAAQDFGKGRDTEWRPHGAREVRQAGYAFMEMKRRIERAMEQRTAMLNGVSHDLRTILTRFKLSLALLGEGPEFEAMQKDIEEMQRMLEAYLAFARGDAGEAAAPTDMRALLEELKADSERQGHPAQIEVSGESTVIVRPDAFKRCLGNLVSNALRYGHRIEISASCDKRFLTVHVDDDGPGIPAGEREDVFRPFYQRDEARTLEEGFGTGLGLAIARDIARSHGGDIQLGQSPLGGLRATVRVPV